MKNDDDDDDGDDNDDVDDGMMMAIYPCSPGLA